MVLSKNGKSEKVFLSGLRWLPWRQTCLPILRGTERTFSEVLNGDFSLTFANYFYFNFLKVLLYTENFLNSRGLLEINVNVFEENIVSIYSLVMCLLYSRWQQCLGIILFFQCYSFHPSPLPAACWLQRGELGYSFRGKTREACLWLSVLVL